MMGLFVGGGYLHGEVLVLGMRHQVQESSPGAWSPDGMGRAEAKKAVITINSEMPFDTKMNTLLHEVMHVIFDHNALSPLIEKDRSEMVIAVLANGLHQFLRDNPEYRRAFDQGTGIIAKTETKGGD